MKIRRFFISNFSRVDGGGRKPQPKAFVVCFAWVFGGGLALLVAVNYWADTANVFHRKLDAADRAAEILAAGRNLGMARNLDDRLVQREYLQRLERTPEVISLGSSRSREISAAVAPPNLRFFNHGVNGGGLEDVVAVLGLYMQRRALPALIIWSVDPWVFNPQFSDPRWRSLADSYQFAAAKIGIDRKQQSPADRLKDIGVRAELLLRLDSAIEIIGNFIDGKGPHQMLAQKVKAVDGDTWDRLLVYSDGSFRWGPSILQRTADEVARYGREAAEKGLLRSIHDYRQLDPNAQEIFEKIVQFLGANGVQLVLFLPPYQPDAYSGMQARGGYQGVGRTENWLRAIARRRGIPLLGSYDPKRAGCGRGDFVDAHHPRRRCINRILGPVATRFGR